MLPVLSTHRCPLVRTSASLQKLTFYIRRYAPTSYKPTRAISGLSIASNNLIRARTGHLTSKRDSPSSVIHLWSRKIPLRTISLSLMTSVPRAHPIQEKQKTFRLTPIARCESAITRSMSKELERQSMPIDILPYHSEFFLYSNANQRGWCFRDGGSRKVQRREELMLQRAQEIRHDQIRERHFRSREQNGPPLLPRPKTTTPPPTVSVQWPERAQPP